MLIAYTEKAGRQFWHVAEVDGFYLARKGNAIMFRETRVVRRESLLTRDGGVVEIVDVIPPRVEITSEFPVADWFEVPGDTPVGVHPIDNITHAA